MVSESAKNDKGVSRWLWLIPVLLVVAGLMVAKSTSSSKRAVHPVASNVQEFHLEVGQETPTVWLKPGDYCKLWANKPYEAVSTTDKRIYQMSAGWEKWENDSDLEGRLRLIGREEGTVVKIQQ